MYKSPQELILRRGKITYTVALLLIATFSLSFHILIDTIVSRESEAARVVNISGRQRMLSQRIVKLALERAVRHDPRLDSRLQVILQESIDRMALVHNGLLHGSSQLGIAPPLPSVLAIYYGPQCHLDSRVQSFLLHARALAARPVGQTSIDDPNLLSLEADARAPLLDALDAAVVINQTNSEQSIAMLRRMFAGLTIIMMVILALEARFLYRPLFHSLAQYHAQLIESGHTDSLTGCFNRTAFNDMMPAFMQRARAASEPLGLILLDLDHFKAVNDRFGHAVGDLVLQVTVRKLLDTLRQTDKVYRIGGEEFVILLTNTPVAEVLPTAERLLRAIASHSVVLPEQTILVTASIGTTHLQLADKHPSDLLIRADRALYRAKREGRDRAEADCLCLEGEASRCTQQHLHPFTSDADLMPTA